MSIFREEACNATSYRLKILFKCFVHHTVSWFVQKFAETNWDVYVPMVHLGLIVRTPILKTELEIGSAKT